MALSARSSALVKAAGSFTELAWGVDATASTTAIITVPQFGKVFSVLIGGNTSTTVPYVDAVSGNTFTLTKANNDVVTWIAFGTAHY